jgi:hypothetical protein
MSNPVTEQFTMACPQCGKQVHATRAHIGKKGRCPACQTVFPILAPETRSASDTLMPNETLLEPLGSLPSSAAPSIWSELGSSAAPTMPATAGQSSGDELRLQSDAAPSASLANDYLHRARNSETFLEQEEKDPGYRFWTSYGSIIGGISMIVFGLFFLIPLFLYVGSLRGVALGVTVIIGGCGWFIQGLNYVFYYRWKAGK